MKCSSSHVKKIKEKNPKIFKNFSNKIRNLCRNLSRLAQFRCEHPHLVPGHGTIHTAPRRQERELCVVLGVGVGWHQEGEESWHSAHGGRGGGGGGVGGGGEDGVDGAPTVDSLMGLVVNHYVHIGFANLSSVHGPTLQHKHILDTIFSFLKRNSVLKKAFSHA